MAIKIDWKDLSKRIINGKEVEKVMLNGVQIWPDVTPPHPDECIIFYFLAYSEWSWQTTRLRIRSWTSWNWDVYVDWVLMPSGDTRLWRGDWQEHYVEIYPVNETYWWAKAFMWCTRMTRLIYDWTYKSFADSATSTWDNYRQWVYSGHDLLTEIPASEESIPDTVLYVWNNFRAEEFGYRASYSSLITPRNETFPRNAISVWNWFRANQYARWRISLSTLNEKFSDSVLTIWSNFRSFQFFKGGVVNAVESMSSNLTSAWDNFRRLQFYYAWIGGNVTLIANNNVSLTGKREGQFDLYYGNARNIEFNIIGDELEQLPSGSWIYWGPMWLITNWVQSIWVKNSLLSSYQTTQPWSSLEDKFI